MNYIDAHTHLFDEQFDKDLSEIVDRAKSAGVFCAQVVAIASSDCKKILELHERFPDFCAPGFGVHPVQHPVCGEVRSVQQEDLDAVIPWIDEHHEKLVCIGEVGLDFTPRWCKTDVEKTSQRSVLSQQIAIAQKYNLPLNVHSRSAGRPTIELLKEKGAQNVLLHAFDGRPAVAMDGVSAGYYFSIPPSIVRSEQVCVTNSEPGVILYLIDVSIVSAKKRKLVERVPLENLILETDSPALGPVKEERNEPANVQVSAECIASIKKVDVETVIRVTLQNTLKLFPKLSSYIPK